MAYSVSRLDRPIQGVSQQPDKVRLAGQCTEQINMRPDVVSGLITRQGSEELSQLPVVVDPTDFLYNYDREGGFEDYIFRITNDANPIRIFSKDGREHIVNYEVGFDKSYFTTNIPKKDLFALTLADTTFVLNKTKTVLASTTLTPEFTATGIIYVRLADYATKLTISIDGSVIAEHTTPDVTETDAKLAIGTGNVATELHTLCTSGLPVGYTISVVSNNAFWITKDDGSDWILEATDDADNENLVAIKGRVDGTDKLPNRAPVDFIVLVSESGIQDNLTDFYVIATAKENGEVYWRETTEPNISVGLDKTTMPVLVRNAVGATLLTLAEFSVEYPVSNEDEPTQSWGERDVGSEKINPLPVFVDDTISSIGLFQDRLSLSSSETLTFSRTSQYFEFFRETGQKVLDGDPVSVFSDTEAVVAIKYTVPFDGDLVAFSDESQFLLSGKEPMTPANAVLKRVTNFGMDVTVPPAISGETIFFPFTYGDFTGVREFFTDSLVDTKRARPITDHVKNYMPTNLNWFVSSTAFNILFSNSKDEPNVIYIYDWLWQGADRVQSAWSKWVFEADVVIDYAYIAESSLFMVVTRSGVSYVEEVNLDRNINELTGFSIALDSRQSMVFTKGLDDIWTSPDLYPNIDDTELGGCKVDDCYPEDIGTDTFLERDNGNLTTEEDLGAGSTATLIVGRFINQRYVPTQPYPTDQEGNAEGDLSKLTVSSMFFSYDYSGTVQGTVVTETGAVNVKESSARIFGANNNTVGFSEARSGFHRFPIRQRASRFRFTLTSKDIQPVQVRTIGFDGNYNPRGKKI